MKSMQLKQNKITVSDVKNYVEGHTRSAIKALLPSHMREQISFRSYLCSDCLLIGKCKNCGCTTPHLFYATDKSDPNWGPILTSKKDWIAQRNTKYLYEYQAFTNFNNIHGLDSRDYKYPAKLRSKILELQAVGTRQSDQLNHETKGSTREDK